MRRLGLVAAALLATGAAAREPLIAEAQWLADGADVIAFATVSPGECLRAPDEGDERYLVEVGRAAFNSPLLLGGPAARGGLSCNSCHRDGGTNPDFFLEGLSDRPGTADVTSSLFSKVRDDGVFNPAPIPTLLGVADKASYGDRAKAPSLHAFIEDAVLHEFQGPAPAPAVLDGIAAYVAHLDPAACRPGPTPRSPARDMDRAARALDAARQALEKGDAPTADFLFLAAQRALGDVNERFAADAHAQNMLAEIASSIAGLRGLAREEPASAAARIAETRADMSALAAKLQKRRTRSLYDAQSIRERLHER